MDLSKFYGVSSPEEIKMANIDYQIQSLINEVDKELKKINNSSLNEYIHVIIKGEKYTKEVRDIVCEIYMKKGWINVTNMTSSENEERPGLTAFKFYL